MCYCPILELLFGYCPILELLFAGFEGVFGRGVVLLSDVVDPILVMLFGVGLLGGGASVIAVVVFELLKDSTLVG